MRFGKAQKDGDVVKAEKTIMGAHPYETFKSDLDELLGAK
jgi:hypothetical protein